MSMPDEITYDSSEFEESLDNDSDYDEMYEEIIPTEEPDFELVDESLHDINFSEFKGDFKSSLKKLGGRLQKTKPRIKKQVRKKRKPLSQTVPVENRANIVPKSHKKALERVIVPRDRKVIVEGVDKFILADNADAAAYKNIGYYKGKKLKELILIFNNTGSTDFNVELFNVSSPVDYLFSTSQNINNRIQLAGGTGASYSDMLYHLLANPTMIVNARFVASGASLLTQQSQALQFISRNTEGKQLIEPLQLNQNLDTFQFQNTVINFDIMGTLGKPYIPDAMNVINYTVLAGMTVTFCFYYKQTSLKKLMLKEARVKKSLI